jgi:hypothetical protein
MTSSSGEPTHAGYMAGHTFCGIPSTANPHLGYYVNEITCLKCRDRLEPTNQRTWWTNRIANDIMARRGTDKAYAGLGPWHPNLDVLRG